MMTRGENLHDEAGSWDIEIKPKTSMFDINLREIWQFRDLLLLFVKRDFTAQYKQTILGPLWHVVQPVFTTLMFLLVFAKIANIPTDGIQPILFYLSGITIWNYFASCLTNTSNTFVSNASIFGKVYFPRMIIPLSIVISNVFRFLIQFGLLVIVMVYMHFNGSPIVLSVSWLLIPFLLILMAGIGLGLGIIISSLTTKYRDFSILVSFGVQLLMYATPIAYPMSVIEQTGYSNIIKANPLTGITECFRNVLFSKGSFDTASILYSTGFMILVLVIGVIVFHRVEKTFMDTV